MKIACHFVGFLLFAIPISAQSGDSAEIAVERTKTLIGEVALKSYPEIKIPKVHVKTFKSEGSFFKARYSIWRYATLQRMRHIVFVNPKVIELDLPDEAFRSIVAHELAHVSYYTRKNRLELLGLIRLTSSSSSAGFERKADLETIVKGYGEGLIVYREWLYRQIPDSQKKSKSKTYFTPKEIRLVQRAAAEKPELIEKWARKVPRDLETIELDTGYE